MDELAEVISLENARTLLLAILIAPDVKDWIGEQDRWAKMLHIDPLQGEARTDPVLIRSRVVSQVMCSDAGMRAAWSFLVGHAKLLNTGEPRLKVYLADLSIHIHRICRLLPPVENYSLYQVNTERRGD